VIAVCFVASGLLTAGIGSGVPGQREAGTRTVDERGELSREESRTIDIFRRAAPSVVHVTSVAVRRDLFTFNLFEIPQGSGTGFLWDSNGHLVTNYHVIQGASSAHVTLTDQTTWDAELVGIAAHKDLAVLRIEAPRESLVPIPLGTSHDLVVGQQVYAIGNPFGLDQTLTTGVISGLGREIQSMTRRPIQGVIQTDAAINPGNSGGPLLDSAGRLIGVNTAIYSPSGAYAGVGFAVPVDTVLRIIPQLIRYGRVIRPGLGVRIADDAFASRLGIEGVVVVVVREGSAAHRAGLRGTQRDRSGRIRLGDVLSAIDSHSIGSNDDLFRALDHYEVGDAVTLTIKRNQDTRKVRLVLQEVGE
jgi:S1-C subfamily serine protease